MPSDNERSEGKYIYYNKQHAWFLDEEVQNNSKLMGQLLDQYILTQDVEEAAARVRAMRLDALVDSLYEAYETTFVQFESHAISVSNPAVQNWSQKCGLSQDKFVEVMKHLSWQVGSVTRDDVQRLTDPSNEDAVINPFDAERASQRVDA